jgi:hypothetical protein
MEIASDGRIEADLLLQTDGEQLMTNLKLETTIIVDNESEKCTAARDVTGTDSGKEMTNKKRKRKTLKLTSGYNLMNPRIGILLENVDEFVNRIESDARFSTSNLLDIKGYGSLKN